MKCFDAGEPTWIKGVYALTVYVRVYTSAVVVGGLG